MKKILLFCLIILTFLVSCTTSNVVSYEERTEEENIKAKDALISAEREALASVETNLFKDNFNIEPNDSLILYSSEIPMFSSTLDDYYESIQNIVLTLLPSLIDTTYTFIDNLSFTYPYYYIQKSFSSVTEEMKASNYDELYTLLLNGINQSSSLMDSSFSLVEREALIWKKNQENLANLGMGKVLVDPVRISNEDIAKFVMDEFFKELAKAEEVVRTRPLSLASNELYSIFWEDLSYE